VLYRVFKYTAVSIFSFPRRTDEGRFYAMRGKGAANHSWRDCGGRSSRRTFFHQINPSASSALRSPTWPIKRTAGGSL